MLKKALFPVFARHRALSRRAASMPAMFHDERKVLENKARRALMNHR
jgi:hypothetical protein